MSKIRVSDYVANFLEKKGIKHAFEVAGGGAMFLNDSIAKSNIKPIFCHHEQSCAMAAVGYTKLTNEVSLVVCTSGCAGTNVITGLLDAWQDSHKLIVISGQVNKKDTTYLKEIPLRKLGVQEVNIVKIVSSITKYSTMIEDANDIAYELEKAYHICTTGRYGPVWIDIPLDIQSAYINEEELKHFDVPENIINNSESKTFKKYLSESKRPIIIAGNGVYLSNSKSQFKNFIEKYQIPVACTFLGIDLLEQTHPLYVGRIGLKGTRAGNFAVANADLIISIGSSLSIPATGFQYHLFAREAKIIVIDIDINEHSKNTVKIDEIINEDINNFIHSNMKLEYKCPSTWVKKCEYWKNKWNLFDRKNIDSLNMYSFSKKLGEITKESKSIVVTDAGSAYYVLCQTLVNSRLIVPGAQAEMGFMIPACIGVSLEAKNNNIIGVTGEGSFQFNIQELQTVVQNKIPIKMFVLNNGGYLSIRNTQTKFFNKNFSGVDASSGISFPDLEKIAYAYGIAFKKISNIEELHLNLKGIIEYNGPYLCEIICPSDEEIYPTSATLKTDDGKMVSQPLENMSPFLSKEDFEQEMIVKIKK
jgi:acetolactate synthase-1/2/3 large subunit